MPVPSRLHRPPSSNGGFLSRTFYEAKLRRRSNARRCTLCFLLVFGSLAVLYEAMWTYWLAGVNIPNVEHDPVTGRDRVRRRPDLSTKYDPSQHSTVHTYVSLVVVIYPGFLPRLVVVCQTHAKPYFPFYGSNSEPFDAIMEGFFTLVDIQIPVEGLVSSGEVPYTNVMASFCQLSWTAQQTDAKRVPLFENLRERSFMCPDTLVQVDLYEIARQAEAYDSGTNKFAATNKPKNLQQVPPTAVVFHESHAGSTLTSSILATSDPRHVHVYSEAPAPHTALMACDNDVHCDLGAQEQLIKDVFYLMGRMNRPTHQHVFYKFNSEAIRSIDIFRKAFPSVPWVFLYRNSIEVMASQLHGYQDSALLLPDKDVPSCLRNRYNQWQHPMLLKVVNFHNRTVSSLTAEEYCAAYLASLAQSALTENEKASSFWAKHMFINYEDLPFILWDKIIPDLEYMSQPVSLRIDAMHDASKLHFTGDSYARVGQPWQEDNTIKQKQATDAMKAASQLFLSSVFMQLESVRTRQVV